MSFLSHSAPPFPSQEAGYTMAGTAAYNVLTPLLRFAINGLHGHRREPVRHNSFFPHICSPLSSWDIVFVKSVGSVRQQFGSYRYSQQTAQRNSPHTTTATQANKDTRQQAHRAPRQHSSQAAASTASSASVTSPTSVSLPQVPESSGISKSPTAAGSSTSTYRRTIIHFILLKAMSPKPWG